MGIEKGIILCMLTLCLGCQSDRKSVEKEVPPVPVTVATAQRGTMENTLHVSGVSEAIQKTAISARTMAEIQEILVETGDQVKKGAILARLDNRNLLSQQAQIRSSVQISGQELKIAESQRKEAEVQLENARLNKERFDILYEQKAVRKKEWEDIVTHYEMLKARVEQAKEKVAISTAQIQTSEAKLKEIEIYLSDCIITAPFSGQVTNRFASIGHMAVPGQPILELTDVSTIKLILEIPDSDYASIQKGQLVQVFLSESEEMFKSEIHALIQAGNPESFTYQAICLFKNDPFQIPAGAFLNAIITTEIRQSVLMIPRNALIESNRQYYVQVIENELASVQPVKIGMKAHDNVEVLSGIREGQQIAIKGKNDLAPGQKVRVTQ